MPLAGEANDVADNRHAENACCGGPPQPNTPAIIAGETPPQVFISSVMGPEADAYRDEAVATIKGIANLKPWAFEYTSASSENPRSGYLRKVRESAIVIWLATRTTTEPVQAEVREALASNRRLLVFRLCQDDASSETEALLAEVQKHVKWVALSADGGFRKALRLTLCDEVSRALQQPCTAVRREELLAEEWRLSISRCVERWVSVQVPRSLAVELAVDHDVGFSVKRLPTTGVAILTGEVGVGKSLALERLYQRALQDFQSNRSTPPPVFLNAHAVTTSLRDVVQSKSQAFCTPGSHGVRVFLDRADEQGEGRLASLLQEARIFAGASPNTCITIASRPIPCLNGVEERIGVSHLSYEQAAAVISKIAKHDTHPYILRSLSPPLREAITRPLFAIIYATCLRRRIDLLPQSDGELLDELAEQAIGRATDRLRASQALRHLATLSVQRDSSPVHVGDILDQEDMRLCCQTGVVVQRGKLVEFPLLVLAHWFAAEALIKGAVDIGAIAASHSEAERWRYPLSIAVAKLSHADATRILAPIVESQPAFASQIVRSAILNTSSLEDYSLPPALECGENLRSALNGWTGAIGPLARTFFPLRNRSTLPPLAVDRQQKSLAISWHGGADDLPAIVETDLQAKDLNRRDWPSHHWSVIGRQPAWAWLWSLDMLSHDVANAVKARAFSIAEGPLADELLWQWVLELTHRGGLWCEPIALDEIETALSRFPQGIVRMFPSSIAINTQRLRDRIDGIRAENNAAWHAPTPGRDLPQGSFAWSGYSDERLLAKTVAVFEKALRGYEQMVAKWFPFFLDRMEHSVTFPARVVGVVIPSDGPGISNSPHVSWYFEPLSRDSECEVVLSLGTEPLPRSSTQDQFKKLSVARPEAASWISAWLEHSVLDIFNATPVTNMVYEWIERDLKKIGWIK